MHLRSPFLLLLGKSVVIHFCTPNIFELPKLPKRKRFRQEEEEELEEAKQGEEEEAAERTGEDLCHLSGYKSP